MKTKYIFSMWCRPQTDHPLLDKVTHLVSMDGTLLCILISTLLWVNMLIIVIFLLVWRVLVQTLSISFSENITMKGCALSRYQIFWRIRWKQTEKNLLYDFWPSTTRNERISLKTWSWWINHGFSIRDRTQNVIKKIWP